VCRQVNAGKTRPICACKYIEKQVKSEHTFSACKALLEKMLSLFEGNIPPSLA